MQMLLAAVLIDALHAALEDRIVAFDRVAMNFGIVVVDVFVAFMM